VGNAMPDYRRAFGGISYFFTVVAHQRQPIFVREDMRAALRTAMAAARRTKPFEIDAFVLLPDHLHCIWRLPEGDTDYPKRWNIIKGVVTQSCRDILEDESHLSEHRIKKRQSSIWQNRYWEHQIRDELDFERHVDYIHYNPVRHGLVTEVRNWPYSSFHRYVRNGTLPPDWGYGKNDDGKFGE
jgi:putative transposase